MGVAVASVEAIQKEFYPNGFGEVVYKSAPALALMKKVERFGGDVLKVPLIYGDAPGRSSDFDTAYAGKDTALPKLAFLVTRKRDYSIFALDNETILSTEGDDAAFVEAVKLYTDRALGGLKQSMALTAFGSGAGRRGRIATGGISSAVITLEDAADGVNFEVGMKLEVAATETGAVRTGSVTVQSVSRGITTTTITCTANVTTGISAAAAGDYIFAKGDHNNLPSGFAAWLPWTDPSGGESYYGVDRSVDRQRLAGTKYDGSSQSLEEALIDGVTSVELNGGLEEEGAGYIFCNPLDRAQLVKELGDRRRYVDVKADKVGLSFKALQFEGNNKALPVIADRRCRRGYAYVIDMSTWEFRSIGAAPRNLVTGMDEDSKDAMQWRMGYYGNIVCNAPGFNGIIKLSTATS